MKARKMGNIYGFNGTGTSYAGNVYDPSYLSPNISGMEGGNRQPMIVAMRGRNPNNPSDRRGGIPLEQRLEPNQEGICNCLTQLYKDNLVLENIDIIQKNHGYNKGGVFKMCPPITSSAFQENNLVMETIKIKQNNKKGYAECKIGGVADLSYPDSKTRRGRVQGGGDVSPALTVTDLGGINRIESKYRIRKLTPLECWRLMGFTDEEFKAAEAVNSNTQLYKQAGNSIVVDVLVGIFRNIIEAMEVEDMADKKMDAEVLKLTIESIRTDLMIDLVKFRKEEPELYAELAADYPTGEATNFLISIGE